MAKCVGRELVEAKGMDVDSLINVLVERALAEMGNYYYFTLLRIHLLGVDGEALRRIIEQVREQDRRHFELLVPRIYELGGRLPESVEQEFGTLSALRVLPVEADVPKILPILLQAAEASVKAYTNLCAMTIGKDNHTYNLALAIRQDEIQHQVRFLEMLGRGAAEPRLQTSAEILLSVGQLGAPLAPVRVGVGA
ncbi:MAG: ferritin-like domain-containing protein [Gammaproteobacteria bacterium]|nr:ferritin-like domain-containing protein [Gammaproteobacteria bacterium]